MANTEPINEDIAKDMVKDILQKYMQNPNKDPPRLDRLEALLGAINDDEMKARILSIQMNEENIYHTAVRQNNSELIQVLNKHLPNKMQDGDSILVKKKKCNRRRRFRGVLYGRDAQCLTPLHLAVLRWRDEGDDTMFRALMEADGLTARQKLEMLCATDEKGRTVIGIAIDADIDQETKEKMVQDVCEELREARKTIDDLAAENSRLQQEVVGLKEEISENVLIAKVDELKKENAAMERRIDEKMRAFELMIDNQDSASMYSVDSGVCAGSAADRVLQNRDIQYSRTTTQELIKPVHFDYHCINNISSF